MSLETTLERYLAGLLAGRRAACRSVIREALAEGIEAKRLYREVLWPAMEAVDQLFRADRINTCTEHMATLVNRVVADQLQAQLPMAEPNGKQVVVTCADGEPEELGAQMCADLFEADGWGVYFLGGGVPQDEIVSLIGKRQPDLLLVFGTQPHGLPAVRLLIDTIRDLGNNPTMNIMISGGVFNRAAGLWEEINADAFAPTADEALPQANRLEPRKPEIRIPGAPKRRRRRRSAVVAVGA